MFVFQLLIALVGAEQLNCVAHQVRFTLLMLRITKSVRSPNRSTLWSY